MAAPSGTVWGSVVGDYGRVGIHVKLTHTNTQTTRVITLWFWSKYSVSDSSNTLYYDAGTTNATSSKGSVSISTSVSSGSGWSTSNQVKLKEYSHTYSRGTSDWKESCAMKLSGIDRVGGTMTATTSYTVPKLASYTVAYNANGGSGQPASQTKYYGKTLTLSNTKPTRTGYTFQGWATSSTGSVAYAAGASYTANAGITLYAKWAANPYTVAYNGNATGASNVPSSQTKWHGTALTLSSQKPTLTGHTFQGWATSSTGSVAYAAGASYTANAAVTLYAKWAANTYTVAYNANTGSGAPASQTKTYGQTLKLSSTIPTKANYNFMGWGTSANATTVSYAAGANYTANAAITLYAIWQLAYTKPRINNASVFRCDAEGTASDDGTNAKVAFNWATDKAVTGITIQYKASTATAWTTATLSATPSGTSGSINEIIADISADASYEFKITVADGETDAYKTTISKSVAGASYPIDVKKGGTGVAFGKVAETADILDSQWPIKEKGELLSEKYTRRVNLRGKAGIDDYKYIVIALCNTTAANTSANSYSMGRLTFHRNNGLNPPCIVDIAMHGDYTAANSVSCSYMQLGYNSATVVVPVTFTYNGIVYGGVKVFFSNACLQYIEFNGASNFDIFGVPYYHANDGVLNSEIYNSLTTVSLGNSWFYTNGYKVINSSNYTEYCAPASHTHSYLPLSGGTISGNTTMTGWLKPNGSVYMKNATTLFFYNSAATSSFSALTMDSSNNLVVGHGSYALKTGATYIRGWNIYFEIPSGGGRIYLQSAATLNHQMNLGSTKASDGNNYYINNNATARFNSLKYASSGGYSSRRYKNRIEYKDMNYWHNAVMKMKPCTYYYNNDDETKHLGLIAEDLVELIPELVGIDEDGKPSSVEYGSLTIPLIGEIQRLNNIVETQQAQIEAMQAQIDELKELIKGIQ